MPISKKEEEAYNSIVDSASPYITLSYVLDDNGNLMSRFHFHPQYDEIFLDLDMISNDNKDIALSPDDIESFAGALMEFAKTARTVVESFNKNETNSTKPKKEIRK